jgi:hypothetical protein
MATARECAYVLPPCAAREPWRNVSTSPNVVIREAHCGESGKMVLPSECRACMDKRK